MNYSSLIKKIDDFIRKYYLNKVLRGSIWLVFIFLISYLVLIIAEYYGYFSPGLKTILFYLFLATQLFLMYLLVVKPLLHYFRLGEIISYEKASEIIGKHFPNIQDKLTNTLQLNKAIADYPHQKELILAAIDQKASQMQPVPFVSAIKISENKRYLPYAAIPICIIVVLAFIAPAILTDGTTRIINHNKTYEKQAPFKFQVQNKKLETVQGEDFLLELKLSGDKIPQEIYLEDGKNRFKLKKQDIISFSYLFKNIQESKNFRFKAGEYYSDTYNLKVLKMPLLIRSSVSLSYPKYLQKKDEQNVNLGDLTVPEGTKITWNLNAENTPYVEFLIQNTKNILKADNRSFRFFYTAKEATFYTINLGNSGKQDELKHQINVIPDRYPQIEVEERTDSLNSRVLYFMGKIGDDYGLNQLSFHYQIKNSTDKSRNGKNVKVPIKFSGKTNANFFYFWPVHTLGIKEGEELSYYFQVSDNDGVNGAKTTRSPEKRYKAPGVNESFEKVNQSTAQVKQKMQSAIRQSQKIQQEAQKLNQELLNSKSLDFEQKKQVEELLDKQDKLEKLLKEISEENKKNILERSQIEKDKELLEKQKQIQELFDNVLDEKTKELLKNLQKLMDERSKDLPQQDDMKQMQSDNKSLQKELDRILELYKKLESEQKLNEQIQKLEDLAQKQLQNSKENDIQKQAEIQKNFEEIKKGLQEAKQKNDALDRPDNYDIKEQQQQEIDKNINDAIKQLQQNNKQQASGSQKEAGQQMQDLAKQLKEMQQDSTEEQISVDMKSLRQLLQNLLKSSFDQENLMLDIKRTDVASPKFTELGKKQREIADNLKIVEDSLFSLSKKVPQISTAVNKEIAQIRENLNNALENIPDRNIPQVNKSQQYALTSINNLALMLSEALQQLQNAMKNAKSGGKGKPQPGMSELSKMQEELNKNMQKAKEQMQKQGLEPGKAGKGSMSRQFSEMAKQQQMIRQALQELNQKMNKDGFGKSGNLEKIMKEMEQTETELVNKRITRESLLRQQEIQIKLLEAEKAERERDQDIEKESKSGKEFAPNYNLILKEYNEIKRKDTELLKTVPPSLNNFYKTKSNQYLDKVKLEE
ncbi:hypothetical protein [Pseudopedobacter sp.]|uniref:DUF4175 family protein n=1 Tax=Pseudopedobacter sp. TaxID=1936787 RepID=UPI003342A13D